MKEMRARRRRDGRKLVTQEVLISKEELRTAMKRMKNRREISPAWRCLGERIVDFLAMQFKMMSERMPEEWRSVLALIFGNKADVQHCSNYRGVKLMRHTMKLWERVTEARLIREVTISEQQYSFMPRQSTRDVMFALKVHSVDLDKAYERVPREEM